MTVYSDRRRGIGFRDERCTPDLHPEQTIGGNVRRTAATPSRVSVDTTRGVFTGFSSSVDRDSDRRMPASSTELLTSFPNATLGAFQSVWTFDSVVSGNRVDDAITVGMPSLFMSSSAPAHGFDNAFYMQDRSLLFSGGSQAISGSTASSLDIGTGSFVIYAVVSMTASSGLTTEWSVLGKYSTSTVTGWKLSFTETGTSGSFKLHLGTEIEGPYSVTVAIENVFTRGPFPLYFTRGTGSGNNLIGLQLQTGSYGYVLSSAPASFNCTGSSLFTIGRFDGVSHPPHMIVHYLAVASGSRASQLTSSYPPAAMYQSLWT